MTAINSNKKTMILVTGACGQIGTELVKALREKHGRDKVVATDRHFASDSLQETGPYFKLDVLDKYELENLVCSLGITQIYHLAAVLSASGENNPLATWNLNMESLLNVLEIARQEKLDKVFWPSSIAVFGPSSPRINCPQHTVTEPTTVYGISKNAGEHWCMYYFEKFGLDVRSLRYPGLISYSAKAGGGTTDYAVDIFHQAVAQGEYVCFLREDTLLPMLYMPDAIRATLELMDAPAEQITVRTSYNLAGLSFTPAELAKAIQTELPGFKISYQPDFRQTIADSWPGSINDSEARNHWNWEPAYNLNAMTADMLKHIGPNTSEKNG
ncbi:NAD-dependent epimerase/dehydratase family protein [Mucilaginibacter paludis]|uniref:NAD-dependent epimerase/dehydratase n=1 Tax=Mucilaginibacter paludis DSM 18603 TaxID=714943 RepID=H1YCY5_9SPHI|nr:NAD-dependent epimerase/dehydratase family protein [Mucilaginibacter paludis]EHQ25156.1 NAD-dependent epimerase/dehydratase [Mucilaginibacter paludis DSM 18603]